MMGSDRLDRTTRNRWSLAAVAALMIVACPSTATAQVPTRIPLQGYLADLDGAPVDGLETVWFRVFDVETGGTALFEEAQALEVEVGHFTAHLGDVEPLDLAIFEMGGTRWLEVEIDGEPLSPRLAMATVPYAAVAGNAERVGGMSATDLAAPSWDHITSVPASIADGDDDTTYDGNDFATSGQACSVGSVVEAIAADGSLVCALDRNTTYSGADFATSNQSCTAGSYVSGVDASGAITCLAQLPPCTAGQVIAWSGTEWQCRAPFIDTNGDGSVPGDLSVVGEISASRISLTGTDRTVPGADGAGWITYGAGYNDTWADCGDGVVKAVRLRRSSTSDQMIIEASCSE